jgi:glycosyltransferase involved in cell wall biosynthesis
MTLKVLLRAPLNPHSGYGNDGLGLAMTFQQAGCDVYLQPTTVQTPLPMQVAELLTKRLEPPFDMLLHHVDPGQLEISERARANSSVTVAMSMWEMSTLDNCHGRSKIRKNLKNYDLVAGYDEVSSAALEPYVTTNLATVQGGYWPDRWRAVRRDFDSPTLNFCMVGALGPRKNPFVAIEAFKQLREEHPELDIALHLKTVSLGLHPRMQDWIPGLHIYYETWPEDVLRDFYSRMHVLISCSRGEGKNMPALEFLSTGGTVIATNWGGHRQWLSPSIGYPLDYDLVPVDKSTPDCLWAEARIAHLKELMLHAATHRDELRRKGELASQLIPEMCSWPRAVDRLMERVGQVAGDRGERVLHKYRVARERARETGQALMLL